jgi:hypothetical protein
MMLVASGHRPAQDGARNAGPEMPAGVGSANNSHLFPLSGHVNALSGDHNWVF